MPTFTTPAIDAVDSLRIKSCVALYVGISSISSIRLQINDNGKGINVSDWYHYDFTDTRYHLYDLIQSVSYVNYLIPSADVYVLEAPPVARPSGPGSVTQLNINIQRSQLIGMISLALNDRKCTNEYHRNVTQSSVDTNSDAVEKHKTLLFLKQFAASRYDFLCFINYCRQALMFSGWFFAVCIVQRLAVNECRMVKLSKN